MKKHAILSFVLIPVVLVLALLSACDNSFVVGILPDRAEKILNDPPLLPPQPEPIGPTEPTEPEPPGPTEPTGPDAITVKIVTSGNETGDNITASPASGKAGTEITLNYTVANAKINNRLTFSGTKAEIAEVDNAETGTRKYSIAEEDATDGVITIIATFAHSDKTLDTIAFANANNVTKTYGDSSFTKAITNSGSGSGSITYNSTDPSVATVNSSGEVIILKAGNTEITATKAEDADYAEATASYFLTIEKRPVTITGLFANNKEYNGTPAATVSGTATIEGKVGSDDVTVSAGTAAFTSKNVGAEKTVTFSGYSLSGADKDNYTLSAQPASVTATITVLPLTIAAPAIAPKTYDGTTTAGVTAGALTNIIGSDMVNVTAVGTYNSANVADASQVTVVYTITGADVDNYIKPVDYKTAGNINKAGGRTVSVPTSASTTIDSITVNAVTVQTPTYGQNVEYAIAKTTSVPSTGWQASPAFTGLESGINYYIFARTAGNVNCETGTASVSAGIKTEAPASAAGIKYDFSTDTLPAEYLDTGNSGKMQVGFTINGASSFAGEISGGVLKIIKTGQNTTASFLLPFNLGTENLSSYNSVKINIRGVSGGSSNDYTNKSIIVYLNNNSTSIGNSGNASLNTTFKDVTVPLTGSRSVTGAIVIGISLGQTTGYTIEIKSIELLK